MFPALTTFGGLLPRLLSIEQHIKPLLPILTLLVKLALDFLTKVCFAAIDF